MNRLDAERLGLANGEMVKVSSRRGTVNARVAVGETTDVGTLFMPFHYHEAAANTLTIAALDPQAKIPEYKVCAVKLEKAA